MLRHGNKDRPQGRCCYCSFIVTSDEQTMKAMSPDQQRAFSRIAYNGLLTATAGKYRQCYGAYGRNHTSYAPRCRADYSRQAIGKDTIRQKRTDFDTNRLCKAGRGAVWLGTRGKGSERTHLTEARFKLQQAEQKLEHAVSEV